MLRRLILLTISLLALYAEDYTWPIKAKPFLSATFCEYREGHFHSGIDIKTWGEMDIPCLAISDGYVERISASYRGYGKVLFLMLDDGRRVIYAHLDYFSPALEKRLRAAQSEIKRYRVDVPFKPNEVRISQGDRIAYTGVSGTQYPHLHFEIRDPDNVPINPIQFFKNLKDTQPPVITHLAFTPLTPSSTVDGSHLPEFVDLTTQPQWKNAKLPEIQTSGIFGLEVNAFDVADDTQNKYAVYKTRLFVDDTLRLDLVYGRAPLETTNLVEKLRPLYSDFSDWRFTRLYQTDDLKPLKYFSNEYDGRLNISPGKHRWQLELEDFNQNHRTVTGSVISQLPISGIWSTTVQFDSVYSFTRTGDAGIPLQPHFYLSSGSKLFPRTTLYGFGNTTWEFHFPGNLELGLRGEINAKNYRTEKFHLMQPRSQIATNLNYKWVSTPFGELLQLRTEHPFVFPTNVQLMGPQDSLDLALEVLSDTSAESRPISKTLKLAFDQFKIGVNPNSSIAFNFKKWERLNPGESADLKLLDGALLVTLYADSAQSTVHFTMDTIATALSGMLWPGFRIVQPDGSSPVSGVFRFHVGSGRARDWQLYKRRGRQLLMLKSEPDGAWLSGQIQDSGDYLLLADNIPPKLLPLASKTTLKPGDKLLFKIEDNLPDRAAAIQIQSSKLNDIKIYPDYNPIRQELSFWLLPDTPPDDYTLKVTLADQAGNRSENSFQFRVR